MVVTDFGLYCIHTVYLYNTIWRLAILRMGATLYNSINTLANIKEQVISRDTFSEVRVNHLRVPSNVLYAESVICFFL